MQGLAKQANALLNGFVADNDTAPHLVQQLVRGYDGRTVANQAQKQFVRQLRQPDSLRSTEDQPPLRVQLKITELYRFFTKHFMCLQGIALGRAYGTTQLSAIEGVPDMNSLTSRLLPVLLVFLLSACGGSGSSSPAAPPPGGPPPTPPSPIEPGVLGDGRIGELVGKIRDRHGLPALGAIVVANGVIVEQAVDGQRAIDSAVAVTTGDKWHLGSVGKAMTATLAAILVEQSLLSWDTTPADVWPGDVSTMHAAYHDVTVVQLLSHQAGLQPDQGIIPSILQTADDAPGSVVEKRRLWARELLELNPANAVGEFNYANGGYIVVGSMLETLTGQSWEALVSSNMFAPLGMMDSGFGAPGTAGQLDQPWGHWMQGGQLVALPPGPGADNKQAIGPAGTIHATMADYALFMFAHLEGELGIPGLVSVDTFQFLHEPVGGHDYALGWRVDDSHAWAQGPLLYHLGTNLRWVANAGIIPGLNAGVLITTNSGAPAALEASDEMAALLLERILASQ